MDSLNCDFFFFFNEVAKKSPTIKNEQALFLNLDSFLCMTFDLGHLQLQILKHS